MIVLANGNSCELADGATLGELIELLGLGARWVVAEVNGEAVDRGAMVSLQLHPGDAVELVRAVAGG
jgi:thiamine biosynthesis protein ThiS